MPDSQHKIVQYCWESRLYLIRYDIPFLPRALLLLCQGIDRTFSPQGAGRTSLFLAELSFTKALVGHSFSSALPNAWIYRYLRLDIFVALANWTQRIGKDISPKRAARPCCPPVCVRLLSSALLCSLLLSCSARSACVVGGTLCRWSVVCSGGGGISCRRYVGLAYSTATVLLLSVLRHPWAETRETEHNLFVIFA